ncbi:MAG TPA: dUTP diphosphatase [Phycisphaerales bacterium]|nr:dUTP diphosphatase [Phycisphaerales bacterium]
MTTDTIEIKLPAPSVAAGSVPLRIKRLDPRAVLPRYQTVGAAGMDLSACLPEAIASITIEPRQIVKVPLGFAMAVPLGYEAQIRARSGLSSTHGLTPVNSPGTIDSDYRGEVIVPLINHGREPFAITHGMRIAQMVIAPVVQVGVVEVNELDETVRGSGGFGSTGKH